MSITPQEVYAALQQIKLLDLNRTRKDVARLARRKHRPNSKYKPLNMTRDNVSRAKGKRFSGVFGKIANPTTGWKPVTSRLSRLYPKVSKLLFNYVRQHAPRDFVFDSITINHNLQCKRHVDRKNAPISFITAVGDYKGGELVLEDPRTKRRKTCNTRHRFLMYDGKNWPHWNNLIRGDKYSIVAYNRYGKGRAKTDETFTPYFV